MGNHKNHWIKSRWDNKLVCDEDYRGEYIVALHNDTNEERVIENGERIAQVVFIPYCAGKVEEVNELEKTERGDKGFGSSGV